MPDRQLRSVTIPEIVLASSSPRRAALLRQIGLPFILSPSQRPEESAGPDTDPAARASRLALAKAQEVAARHGRGVVIGADTIVVCEGHVMGKPRTPDEAREFLLRLAGRTHQVITGLAVVEAGSGRAEVAASVTAVRMRPFGPAEAAAYVATGEPLDKAGAYAIQGRGAVLVDRIEGDYFNVVGLPLATLTELLRHFGLDVWEAARP